MAAVRVVPALDEVEHGHARLELGLEAPPLQEVALQGGEKTLAQGVVVGVPHRAIEGRTPASRQRRPKASEVTACPGRSGG
jgi:hypothetical protein